MPLCCAAQVFAVSLMYSFGGSVGNYQYTIQDLLYTTVIASLMGFTHPAAKLSRDRPPDRLMSLGIWLPVACQFFTCALFQVGITGSALGRPLRLGSLCASWRAYAGSLQRLLVGP